MGIMQLMGLATATVLVGATWFAGWHLGRTGDMFGAVGLGGLGLLAAGTTVAVNLGVQA